MSHSSVDPRSVAISGVTTFAWYAVPDVVRPRGARALAKTAVLATGVALATFATRDGAEARGAIREMRDQVDAAVEAQRADLFAEPGESMPTMPVEPHEPGSGRAVAATVVAAAGGLAVAAVGVLGERWLHRTAEKLGARGLRAPHTTIGLVMGAAAAGLASIDLPVSAERSRSAAG